jgi:hypothetical protein
MRTTIEGVNGRDDLSGYAMVQRANWRTDPLLSTAVRDEGLQPVGRRVSLAGVRVGLARVPVAAWLSSLRRRNRGVNRTGETRNVVVSTRQANTQALSRTTLDATAEESGAPV